MNIYEAAKRALAEGKYMKENSLSRVKVKVEERDVCTLLRLDGSHPVRDGNQQEENCCLKNGNHGINCARTNREVSRDAETCIITDRKEKPKPEGRH